MNIESIFFWVFALILCAAALQVITAKNPVHAVLFLVLSFFSSAAIWLMLRAEFLAITLVLVYVGAVMVLFIFVVMMLDIDVEKMRARLRSHLPIGLTVGALMAFEMTLVILKVFWLPTVSQAQYPPQYNNTAALGGVLYTEYVYAFEIAAVILLVAIVAAIALTLRHRKDTRRIDPGRQVRVHAADRVRLVSIASGGGVPSAAAFNAVRATNAANVISAATAPDVVSSPTILSGTAPANGGRA